MIAIPYGKSHLDVAFPYNGLLTSRVDELKSDRTGRELVEEAMASPIGTPGLAALAAGKKRCTIIISDHTRPVPSRDILPPMLAQLRQGNPEIRVTLLVATGFHRLTTTAELEAKLGKEIAGSEKIVVHDAFDPESNVQIGVLPSGAPLVIDRTAVDTYLLIAEGFIEPHFFAGFSGGRKSILPGVCDKTTVLGNHCGAFIASPYARTGILEGNPLHRDMVAAAEMAKLAYIVNVVIDEEKKTVAAFAGDFRKAHEAGVAFLRQYCEVQAVPGDLDIRCVSRDLVARRVRIVADELGALKRILARGSAHRAPAERKQSEIFESRAPKRKRFVREQTYPVYIVDDLRRDSVLFQRFEQKYERQRMVGASRDSSDKSQRIRAARYGTADRKLRVRLILHRRGTVQLHAVGNGGYRIHIADEHVGHKPERECVIPSAVGGNHQSLLGKRRAKRRYALSAEYYYCVHKDLL